MKHINYQSYEAYQQTFNVPALTTSLLPTQSTILTQQSEQQQQQNHSSPFSSHGLNHQQYRNLNTNNNGVRVQHRHQKLLQKQQPYIQMNYYQQLQLQQQNQQQQDQQEYLKHNKFNTFSTNLVNITSSKSQQLRLAARSISLPMQSSVNPSSQVYDNCYCGNFDRMAKNNLNLSFLQNNIKNNEYVNDENHKHFNDITIYENQYHDNQQQGQQQNCLYIQQQQSQLNMEQLERHIKGYDLQKNALQQQQVQNQRLYQTCLPEQNFDVQLKENDCKFSLNACEISNFLANELFVQQLATVDGMQSGVPTLTTSTLTPTTLRSIEETFIQLTSEPVNAPYQAGFIPPPLATYPSASSTPAASGFNGNIQEFTDANPETDSEDSQNSWNAAQINEENSLATTDTSSAATDSTSFQNGLNGLVNSNLNATSNASVTNDFNIAMAAISAAAKNNSLTSNISNISNSVTNLTSSTATTITRRNQGGRRPTKPSNLSPEEEEKRRVRRERNKLAAARCRKRRVDQTNELLEEVAQLEKKRDGLNKDIEKLNMAKQELEYILEAHRPTCQKIRDDLLSVNTFGGLIVPAASTDTNSNDSSSGNITGLDTTLASTGRSASPIDLKPIIMQDAILHIKNEPLDSTLDSNSSLDHDGPPSPKRMLLTSNNPMIPPPLPNVATLTASLAAASASLNTPIMTVAPVNFAAFSTSNNNTTLNALNTKSSNNGGKQRPNSLPTMPRNSNQNLGLNVNNKLPTDINGVAIQTPSTGMFNFDSLMDGGTGLTPVSGPLVPTCSSQNKHPLELATPTSEPSKLVSL